MKNDDINKKNEFKQRRGIKRQLTLEQTSLKVNIYRERLKDVLSRLESEYKNVKKDQSYSTLIEDTRESVKALELELRCLIKDRNKK